ncbi:mucoidy inhibitor MuiA family protein [Kitasatospora sp. NPDC049258]|uniref:mucoidy inhibitor MuiA family protein n=1 Tax=Kitasatospora sp. NPDC049258 TaxID=3155394 RepID=UPI00342BB353
MADRTVLGWESELDSVTVYATGALCRRRARGPVPADGRIRLPGLPRSLDAGSLRARVLGEGTARVTEARLAVEAELREPSALPELRRRADRARDERDAAHQRHARQLTLVEEVAALRAVPPQRRREEPHRRTPTEAWLELADFVEERLTTLHERAAELGEQLRLAEHALALAEDELARAADSTPDRPVATSATALLTVAGAGGTELELELEYGVPGAVWVPTYRLSHRQGEPTGQLVLRASVAQRTGEDWTGVRLSLSTADLRRRAELPKLRSIRIGRRQSAPAPSGWREPPAGLADLFAGYDTAGPGPDRVRPLPPAAARPSPPPAPGPRAAAPQGYGGTLGADTAPFPAAPGGPPPVGAAGPVPQPHAPVAQAAVTRSRAFGGGGASPDVMKRRSAPAAFAPSASAPAGYAPAPPPPPPGPPQPDAALLDYSALTLAGPEAPAARRGRLLPRQGADPVAAEHRRRAEQVAGLPLPGHAVRPRESAGSFDHRFDAAAPADIPSDGTWHTVTVAELPVGLRTEYVCVPAVEEAVYATLVLANATDQALLAGPVEVSVDGDHLLTAALPTLAPGGSRRVGLGLAEGIRVARRTELRESTAGMLNNTTVLDHRVHVELANRLAGPALVEVRERVPVSSDPDVRVEERADWRAPDQPSASYPPSARIWRVELPAGGTAALDGGYEIRIPAGKALVDGNRRS